MKLSIEEIDEIIDDTTGSLLAWVDKKDRFMVHQFEKMMKYKLREEEFDRKPKVRFKKYWFYKFLPIIHKLRDMNYKLFTTYHEEKH